MADLSKILQKESEGIMFPFRTGVQSTTTEQQVYDSATDGIMTVTGQQYTLPEYKGPTATVQYGTEEQGYPRMLREIEQGELPQFRQEDFPEVGTGIMQPSTPVTQPVDTTPTTEPEAPAYDPCPPGYQLVNGVCQPIQQDRGRDRPTYTGPEISDAGVIEGYTSVLGRYEPDALNATRMLEAEQKYGTELSSKIGEVNEKYRNRGVQIKQESDAEIERLRKVYGQERIDKDYTLGNDGKYYRVIATSPTLGELAEDAGVAIGEIVEGIVEKGPIIPAVVKGLVNEFTDYFTKGEDKTISAEQGTPEDVPTEKIDAGTTKVADTETPVLTTQDFGGINKISDTALNFASNFGTLQNTIVTNQEKLNNLFKQLSKLQTEVVTRTPRAIQENRGKQESLKNLIQETRGKISISKAQSEREEKDLQNTINNSTESRRQIGNQTIIEHKDDKGKTVGYSTLNKPNVVNVAGMPPIGPGQRIKSSGGGNSDKSKSTGTGYSGNKKTGTTGGGILRGGI